MKTVIVVDDDASVRRALARLLYSAGYRVEESDSAESFLEACPAIDAACAVLDVQLPQLDGMALQKKLSGRDGYPPIVFLTGYANIPMTVRAMKNGAVDFLEKPVDEEELLAAVREAVRLDKTNRARAERLQALRARFDLLTQREAEVLRHVIKGMLNKQIAGQLNISEKTVKVHRARVMGKLGIRSVAELVRLAGQAGIQPE